MPLPRANPLLTVHRLREVLRYDPLTGVFTQAAPRQGAPFVPGKIVHGVRLKGGYRSMRIDSKSYLAHRLAWLYVHGEWPPHTIDHINLIKDDNRIANLRVATNSEQHRNMPLTRANTSGFKGVTWREKRKKWEANISLPGRRQKFLGYFDTAEEAHAAYTAAAKEHFGKFARAA